MDRTEAINAIKSKLGDLSTDQLSALADLADALTRDILPESVATRHAIAEGLAESDRGEFATDAEVAAAFARFHK